jgi:hypothetical protein
MNTLAFIINLDFPDHIDPLPHAKAIADALRAQALHGVPRVFPDQGVHLAPGDLVVAVDGGGEVSMDEEVLQIDQTGEVVREDGKLRFIPRAAATVLMLAGALFFGAGCASLTTKQESIAPDGSSRTTTARVSTFWDSKSELAKLRTTMTDKSQGVGIAGLEQESSATNAVSLVESVVGAAIRAAVKP